MLVSEYRTFITPKTTDPSKTKELYKEDSSIRFTLQQTPKKNIPSSAALRATFPDYIQNRNYFANKERFGRKKETPAALKNFQQLSKLKQLKKAYSASYVTFSDLTKPKKVLSGNRFNAYKSVDKSFTTLSLLALRSLANATYRANDIYYKQAYAS